MHTSERTRTRHGRTKYNGHRRQNTNRQDIKPLEHDKVSNIKVNYIQFHLSCKVPSSALYYM